MGSYIIPCCSGCCSGSCGNTCNWTSGCSQWWDTYTFLASGFQSGPCTVLNGPWVLQRPAPVNSFICSWGNVSGQSFPCPGPIESGTQWILRFDQIGGPLAGYKFSGNALNCDNTVSGLFYGVLFSVIQCAEEPSYYCYYVTSGYINSGAWNCSGPTTLFVGPNTIYQSFGNPEQGVPVACASGPSVPFSLTVNPQF